MHKVQDIGLALALEIELALVLEIAIVSTSARELEIIEKVFTSPLPLSAQRLQPPHHPWAPTNPPPHGPNHPNTPVYELTHSDANHPTSPICQLMYHP